MKRAMLWQRRMLAPAIAVVVVSIYAVSATAVAEDSASPPRIAPNRIASAAIKDVTIQEKTPMDILADEERFSVTPAVAITMGDENISLDQLPVPCRARVYFEKRMNQDSEALKIEIQNVNADADIQWAVSPE